MVRSIVGVVVGIVVAGFLVFAIQALNYFVYPPPADLNLNDPEALRAYVEKAPLTALAVVLMSWTVGAFAGAWVAARLASRAPQTHGLVVGAVMLVLTVANFFQFDHPLWIMVAGVIVPPLAAFLGGRLVKPRTLAGVSLVA